MVRYTAVVLVCLVLSCGSRSEVKGRALVLRACSNSTAAAAHDAGVIARRLEFLGYSRCAVQARDSPITVQSPTPLDSTQVAAVASARGALCLYEVRSDSATAAALNSVAAYYDQPQSRQSLADFTRVVQDSGGGGCFWVRPDDYDLLVELLNRAAGAWPEGAGFAFGPVETYEGKTLRRFYVTGAEPVITDGGVQRVKIANIDTAQTRTRPRPFSVQIVDFCLSDSNFTRLSQLTARNVGRRLAIAVDSVVYSAPVVHDRVTDGRVSIAMYDAPAVEAQLLAATISAGPLQTSWRIAGEKP